MSQLLDALTFPLHGSRLIEASAGTGKTWTIAALYLRLVLGHGGADAFARPLLPAQILVMTFTRAATRELSNRVRERLVQAAAYFRGEAQQQDPYLDELAEAYAPGSERSRAVEAIAIADADRRKALPLRQLGDVLGVDRPFQHRIARQDAERDKRGMRHHRSLGTPRPKRKGCFASIPVRPSRRRRRRAATD